MLSHVQGSGFRGAVYSVIHHHESQVKSILANIKSNRISVTEGFQQLSVVIATAKDGHISHQTLESVYHAGLSQINTNLAVRQSAYGAVQAQQAKLEFQSVEIAEIEASYQLVQSISTYHPRTICACATQSIMISEQFNTFHEYVRSYETVNSNGTQFARVSEILIEVTSIHRDIIVQNSFNIQHEHHQRFVHMTISLWRHCSVEIRGKILQKLCCTHDKLTELLHFIRTGIAAGLYLAKEELEYIFKAVFHHICCAARHTVDFVVTLAHHIVCELTNLLRLAYHAGQFVFQETVVMIRALIHGILKTANLTIHGAKFLLDTLCLTLKSCCEHRHAVFNCQDADYYIETLSVHYQSVELRTAAIEYKRDCLAS